MKNYFWGVITAALAALLAYVAQTYFDEYTKSNDYSLEHTTYAPTLVITKADTSKWFNSDTVPEDQRNLFDRLNIYLVEVENVGNEPLTNQEVRVSPATRDEDW